MNVSLARMCIITRTIPCHTLQERTPARKTPHHAPLPPATPPPPSSLFFLIFCILNVRDFGNPPFEGPGFSHIYSPHTSHQHTLCLKGQTWGAGQSEQSGAHCLLLLLLLPPPSPPRRARTKCNVAPPSRLKSVAVLSSALLTHKKAD